MESLRCIIYSGDGESAEVKLGQQKKKVQRCFLFIIRFVVYISEGCMQVQEVYIVNYKYIMYVFLFDFYFLFIFLLIFIDLIINPFSKLNLISILLILFHFICLYFFFLRK